MKLKQKINLPNCLEYSSRIGNKIADKKSYNDSIHNDKQVNLKNKNHISLKNIFAQTQELSPYQNIKILLKNKNDNSEKNVKYEIKDNSFNNINSVTNKKNKGTQKNFIDSNKIEKISKNTYLIPKKSKIWNIKVKNTFKNKNLNTLNNNSRNISFNNRKKNISNFDYCLNFKNKSEILKKNSSQIINIYSYVDNKSNRKKIIKQNIIKLFSSNKKSRNFKNYEISRNSSRELSYNNKRIINKFKNKYNNINRVENSIKSLDDYKRKSFIEELNSLNQRINTKQKYSNQFSFRNTYVSRCNKDWKTAVLNSIIKNIRDIGKDPDKIKHQRNNIKIYTILNLNKKK